MPYAGFWMRLLASIVDAIVLGIITAPVGLLVDNFAASLLLQTVIDAVYTIGFWLSRGATPGKMAMSMEIVMADGRPLTGEAAVLRYVGYVVNVLTLGIGYLMIAFTPEKRGLHDYIAGTVVVRKA
ncbi:MAG TPA: RDD family protein [Dehalococcoidia bacterium]|nr:RDD family protein [Dehalococcoidia bacterium]